MPKCDILSIGAGMRRHPGAIHCDKRPLPGIDVVHDLNSYPWPFESGWASRVIAFDVLEHLDDVIRAVEECHRILRMGGTLWIHTNYWNTKQAFTDPTHKHFFTEESFDFFCPGTFLGDNYGFYSACKFRKIEWHMEATEMVMTLIKTDGGHGHA